MDEQPPAWFMEGGLTAPSNTDVINEAAAEANVLRMRVTDAFGNYLAPEGNEADYQRYIDVATSTHAQFPEKLYPLLHGIAGN